MSFELRGNCVWKLDPDELVKCHDTSEEARAQLAALQANVEESITSYKEAAFSPDGDTAMTGKSWNVTVMGPNKPSDIVTGPDGKKYLKSKNKRLYDLAGLEASVNNGAFNGIQVFDNHLTDAEFEQKQGMRSADGELLGAIVSPYWDIETSSIKGTHKIIKEDLGKKILNAKDADILNIFGLSVDVKPIMGQDVQIGSEFFPVVTGIAEVSSVDLVSKPAAGGKFNHVLAAENNKESENNRSVETMERDELEKIIGEITLAQMEAREKEQRAKDRDEAKAQKELEEQEAEEERLRLEQEAETEVEAKTQESKTDKRVAILECQMLLIDRLNESQLSVANKGIVSQAMAERIFEAPELDTMIKTVQEAEAGRDATGQVTGNGSTRNEPITGTTGLERATLDFMRIALGHTEFNKLEHNDDKVLKTRLPEAFDTYRNGKSKYQLGRTPKLSEWVYNCVGGNPFIPSEIQPRNKEAITTSNMTSIVKNTINLMIANDYSVMLKWWEPIVKTQEVDNIDDVTLVALHGISDLDVVDEGAAYTELGWSDKEEVSSFVKRGNFVSVTLEAMLKDKLMAIQTLPTRLANSWWNTISARVAAVFTNNSNTGPVLTDTGALFNNTVTSTTGGHANLLTAALSFTSWGASRTAMRAQTDQEEGAGKKLLLNPKFLLIPDDLETTAIQIRNSEKDPDNAENAINPFFGKFEIVVVPEWTDANDWATVADPNISAALWMIFLTGNTVPSIFTADDETSGAMFTNDQLRWKVRQMAYRFSPTYDNAPISDFRGLHKNNVT
jgi:hypothetical protein